MGTCQSKHDRSEEEEEYFGTRGASDTTASSTGEAQVFVKQQCLGAIGLLHTQQKKVSGEQKNVQARADAADALSFAENYANVARAAELQSDVDSLCAQLTRVMENYKENGFAKVPLEPAAKAGGFAAGVSVANDPTIGSLTLALERTQQHIGSALVDTSPSDTLSSTLQELEQLYETQQTELLAMISVDVTTTADAYAAAQAAALAAAGGTEAMERLLGRMETLPGSKVKQKISTELSLGVRRGLPVDVLLARAAEEAHDIHQKIESAMRRLKIGGVKYKAGPLKELQRVLAKIYQKYNGDASGVTDVVRGSVYCKGYVEMDEAVAEIVRDPEIQVLRGKATVNPAHDASNTGGYRDIQLLLYVEGLSLVFEVQFALESMAAVKAAGGHIAYTAARAAGAYSKSVYEYRGELTPGIVAAVASGTLRGVAFTRVRDELYSPVLLASMFDALQAKTCRVIRLGLHGLKLNDADRSKLAEALKARPALFTELDLGDNECNFAGMEQLAGAISEQTAMKSLILRQNKLDVDGAGLVVGALKCLSELETLSLASNPFNKEGAEVIAQGLRHLPKLKWLGIAGCNFLADGIKPICDALPSNPNLEFLSFENNDLGPASAPHVAQVLSHLPKLVWLNLGLNFMKAEGIMHITKVLHLLPNLESLELGANSLKTEGVKLVCEQLIHLPKLKFLNFEQAVCKDAGVEYIAEGLKRVPTLQSLNLRGNKLKSVSSAQLVAGLKHLPKLAVLDLSRNAFDDAAQAEIIGVVPDGCDVTF
jgi:Ran GTPase-activating protein (RanGAP) involved in mRNA processing and transport